MLDFLVPFEPPVGLKGGLTQTILGSKMEGDISLPARKIHKIEIEPDNVLICLEIEPPAPDAPMVLLAHGMGGCCDSAYLRRIARKLVQSGFGVFMVNHRGSGPGMGMANRLWNGGSSGDLAAMVETLGRLHPESPLLLVGFSLSGNILLKYLGEERKISKNVFAALAVNPPIDLKDASQRISHGPLARTFNRYYMGLINRQIDAMKECFPETFLPPGKASTIYEFDCYYTAPAGGYEDVHDYYRRASAHHYLKNIKITTTILCSQDDPFVDSRIIVESPKSLCIDTVFPEYGGHMGYLSRKRLPTGDRRWMDYLVLEWAYRSVPSFNPGKKIKLI